MTKKEIIDNTTKHRDNVVRFFTKLEAGKFKTLDSAIESINNRRITDESKKILTEYVNSLYNSKQSKIIGLKNQVFFIIFIYVPILNTIFNLVSIYFLRHSESLLNGFPIWIKISTVVTFLVSILGMYFFINKSYNFNQRLTIWKRKLAGCLGRNAEE